LWELFIKNQKVINNGQLSKPRKKEFAQLTDDEVLAIERKYEDIFQGNGSD